MRLGRLAVRLPNWLGDVIMATPFLNFISKVADGDVVLVGKERFKLILENRLYSDFVPLTGLLRTASSLRSLGVDTFFVLPNSFGSALMAFLSGAKVRVGYSKDGRAPLLSFPVSPPSIILDMPRYYLLLASLFFGVDLPAFSGLSLRTPDDSRFFDRVRPMNLKGGDYAVFVPGASYGPSKMWPAEYFRRLAAFVVAYFGIPVLVCPGPGEEIIATAIGDGVRGVYVMCDPVLDLEELSSAIKNAAFLVSNDTGPRHMGEAFSTPTVVLMGPTDPSYTNYPSRFTRVIRKEISCSPCHMKVCPRNLECLRSIDPREVFHVIRGITLDTGPHPF